MSSDSAKTRCVGIDRLSIGWYFQMAHEPGVPNRPDLVFRRNYSLRLVKRGILSRAYSTSSLMKYCAQFSAISSVLAHPDSIERNPRISVTTRFLLPT